jgi:L-iditol 2-dehydrogenase
VILQLKTVAVPQPDADEVICKVDTTFICGTDPHIINGDFPGFWPKGYPFIPGHEWSGTVVQTGQKASKLGWKEGDQSLRYLSLRLWLLCYVFERPL